MNGPDPLRVEHLLAAAHHILQEIDGDVVVRREVDAGVGGEEVVYLPLAAVLGRELLGGYLGIRSWTRVETNIRLVGRGHLHVILIHIGHIK